MIRTRYAPSPTGPLHVGGARTALFNYLFALSLNGKFILRMEDTDRERSFPEFEKDIINSLEWLGIIPDESPFKGGSFGPYRQSERFDIYASALEKLKEKELIYQCFCTTDELELLHMEQVRRRVKTGYDGRCARLTSEERARFIDEHKSFAWRFSLPSKKVVFNDLIRGKIEIDLSTLSDFVLVKSDGTPSYHLAVVVDDIAMKITHVLRGEDHLTNTGLHIALYEAMEVTPPGFGHFPLVITQEKGKISKREPYALISELRKDGFLPEAVVSYLIQLGYTPARRLVRIDELAKEFDLNKIGTSPSVFDRGMLESINKDWMVRLQPEELISRMLQEGYIKDRKIEKNAVKWIVLWAENSANLKELVSNLDLYYEAPKNLKRRYIDLSEEELKTIGKFFKSQIIEKNFIEELISYTEAKGLKKSQILRTLRIVLTGKDKGPSVYRIVELLGYKNSKERIENALKELKWD